MDDPGLIVLGCIVGFVAWFVVRCLVMGFFTVDQNERAVKTCFGRAERVGTATTLDDPIAESLQTEENASAIVIRRFASSIRAARISNGPGKKSTRSPSPRRR